MQSVPKNRTSWRFSVRHRVADIKRGMTPRVQVGAGGAPRCGAPRCGPPRCGPPPDERPACVSHEPGEPGLHLMAERTECTALSDGSARLNRTARAQAAELIGKRVYRRHGLAGIFVDDRMTGIGGGFKRRTQHLLI